MENQHRKIGGYRDLTEEEVALMNQIKEKAREVGELIDALQGGGDMTLVDPETLDQRAIAIGKTNLQTGFMWVIRGVAQPQGFG